MSLSRERISLGLKALGLKGSISQRSSEGDYEPFDAEWNYKDIPHLAEVHHAVDGVVIASETDHTSSIFLQQVGPFRVPLIVYIGDGSESCAVYVGSAGPFVILVETSWKQVGEMRTRVTTTYEIFSSKALRFLHSVVHRLMSRNYDVLMTADLPMRDQRGRLRKLGYRFTGDTSGYGFRESSNVHVRNIIAPRLLQNPTIGVRLSDLPEGRSVCGGVGEDGIVVERTESTFVVYPRICDHEGADLSCAVKQEKGLRCPWHGRTVRPIAVVDLSTYSATAPTSNTTVELKKDYLEITRRID